VTAVVAPSGEQFEIRHGSQHAVVVEVGGGLRSYDVGDRAVLDGYDVDAMADGARCQTLMPWPNRVQDGKWTWRGTPMQLAVTEPEQNNAIHGLVRWMSWSAVEQTPSSVTVRCVSHPQPGYPWTVEIHNAFSLSDAGLTVRSTVLNQSATDAPVAVGFHPYITVGGEKIDTALLTVPAKTRLLNGYQQIPLGRAPVANTPFDFRAPYLLEDLEIDHAYTELIRDADGLARLRLEDPDSGTSVTVWVDAAYPYLEVFTGDALPNPARRRQGLGVEPMSAPPNALVTGEGVVTLAPGQVWEGNWGIDPGLAEPLTLA
jgi:aldose 1-epimerase